MKKKNFVFFQIEQNKKFVFIKLTIHYNLTINLNICQIAIL